MNTLCFCEIALATFFNQNVFLAFFVCYNRVNFLFWEVSHGN